MKICYIGNGNSGTDYYRAHYPAQLLQAEGYEVSQYNLCDFDGDRLAPVVDGNVLDAPDVIVLMGVGVFDVSKAIARAKKSGQTVLYDIDDWAWGAPSNNPGFDAGRVRASDGTTYLTRVRAAMAECDGVLCSTPYLAERVRRFCRRTFVAPNVFAVVQEKDYVRPERTRIGWAGGTDAHVDDLVHIKGFLGPIIKELDAEMVHIGHTDDTPSFAELTGVDCEDMILYPRTSFEGYYQSLRDANLTLGIVPLRDNPFNRAKTSTKGTEYALNAIPFVASPTATYNLDYPFSSQPFRHWLSFLRAARYYHIDHSKSIRELACTNISKWHLQYLAAFTRAINPL